MTTDTPSDLVKRLRSWAQNEEMIDTSFTEHGKVCNAAADLIEKFERERDEPTELSYEKAERVARARLGRKS